MPRDQEYSRVQYAGYEFRTEASQSDLLCDNSKVRQPVLGPRRILQQQYGSIQRIFTHEAWEGGPKLCVLQVNWYTNRGVSAVSGNPLVQMEPGAAEAKDRLHETTRLTLQLPNLSINAGCARLETATRCRSLCGPMIRLIFWR